MSLESSLRPRRRKVSPINLVPMVDVLMVLLFFFLISMQFGDLRALNISLPKIETAGENVVDRMMVIQLRADGALFLNNEPVDEALLETAVQLQASVDRETQVLLAMDREMPVREMTRIIDLCRRNGLQRVRLQSE